MPGRLPFDAADAVVCSALLDLASRDWLEALVLALHVPFYAALSVEGHARFMPPHPADNVVRQCFRQDQRRPKGLGCGNFRWAGSRTAIGKNASPDRLHRAYRVSLVPGGR